jgi:uncharacterized protein YecT (DUF1311 family)
MPIRRLYTEPKSRFVSLAMAWLVFALPASPSVAASFNCARAQTADEIVICSDPALSAIDSDLGLAFRTLRAQLSDADREKLRLDELQWIRYRNDRCGLGENAQVSPSPVGHYRTCLYPLYEARIGELRSHLAISGRQLPHPRRRPYNQHRQSLKVNLGCRDKNQYHPELPLLLTRPAIS